MRQGRSAVFSAGYAFQIKSGCFGAGQGDETRSEPGQTNEGETGEEGNADHNHWQNQCTYRSADMTQPIGQGKTG